MAELLLEKFVIDGVQHDYLPGAFEDLTTGDFKVRAESYPILNNKRLVVVQSAPADTDNLYAERRKLSRQAWRASFDAEAWMDMCMRDQLMTLYTLQKSFWIQFDDEMSRCLGNLFTVGREFRGYFTPTYPIAPFGYTPDNPTYYNGTIYVNGVGVTGGFDVDSETGMVRFTDALDVDAKVQMKYTWRVFVRIAEIDIKANLLAQGTYVGSVIFEQMTPDYTLDPWDYVLPCDSCELPSVAGNSNTTQFSNNPPSGTSNPSQANTQGYGLSNPVDASGGAGDTNTGEATLDISTIGMGA